MYLLKEQSKISEYFIHSTVCYCRLHTYILLHCKFSAVYLYFIRYGRKDYLKNCSVELWWRCLERGNIFPNKIKTL